MLLNLITGIASSLIASAIVGILGNKAIANNNSIILKVYILFLSMTTFIVSGMISVILNSRFLDRVEKMKEVNILKFYSNCIYSFIFILGMVVIVSVIIILIEALNRIEKREHRENMNRINTYKKK
jgi:hypothetical protein